MEPAISIETSDPTFAGNPPSVIGPFSAMSGLSEDASPARDRLISGSPAGVATSYYASLDGAVQAGHWQCTPGRWAVSYDETEYCRIIAGHGAIIDGSGRRTPIAAGDEFVIPAGFTGEWHVIETMTKTYVIIL